MRDTHDGRRPLTKPRRLRHHHFCNPNKKERKKESHTFLHHPYQGTKQKKKFRFHHISGPDVPSRRERKHPSSVWLCACCVDPTTIRESIKTSNHSYLLHPPTYFIYIYIYIYIVIYIIECNIINKNNMNNNKYDSTTEPEAM
jgi:hypothetical protein